MLKIGITFSIAPTKMKIFLSLFIFTHAKFIYIWKGEQISFLIMVPIKIKIKGTGEKN